MAGVGSGDLLAAAEELFAIGVTALEDTIGGVPDCRYISPGPPAWDFLPSFVVHVGAAIVGDTLPLQPQLQPGHRVQQTGQVNLVPLTMTILRCAPVIGEDGQMPPLADYHAASAEVLSDVWAIWSHVRQAKRSEALFAPSAREFFMDPALPVNQAGGACGWQITVRTELDGYTPAFV